MSYGKVYEAYWDGDKIEPLSDRAALLGLFLITGPHRNAIGCFKLGIGAITDVERFGKWGIEGVSKALQEMMDTNFIVRDCKTGWTLITNSLRKDPINGPKVAIHAAQLADKVPKNSPVYSALYGILKPQLERHAKALDGKIGYPMGAPSEGVSQAPSHTPSDTLSHTQAIPSTSTSTSTFTSTSTSTASLPAADDSDLVKRAMAVADQIDDIANIRARRRVDQPVEWRPVLGWLQAGVDPELDVYPVVREIMARDNPPAPKSVNYFSAAVHRAHEQRLAGRSSSSGNGASQPPKPYDPEDRVNALPERALRDYLAVWRRTGTWVDLGPRPDSPQAFARVKAMVETLKREWVAAERQAEAAEAEP